MTELDQARALEATRYQKALKALEAQEESRIARVDAEMARRGLQHSDARLQALIEVRVDTLSQAIDRRIEIRKELMRSFPELGSARELTGLMEPIRQEITKLWTFCESSGLIVAPEVFGGLRDRGQEGIDILKREAALSPRPKSRAATVSVSAPTRSVAWSPPAPPKPAASAANSPGGTAGNLDAVYGKIEEVFRDVERRDMKLAVALRQFGAAIKAAPRTADERARYLEQLQFIAEQSLRPAVLRRVGVVEGLFVALRTGFRDSAPVGPVLKAAGPVLASHFGLKWPSV